jgi:hypothetical protein
MTVQQGITIETPQTRAQLDALILTRSELTGQLSTLMQRRAELADQIARTSGAENRAELQTRLRDVDARIRRLESQIDAANDAITQGIARGLGQEAARPARAPTPPIPAVPPSVPQVIHIPPIGGGPGVGLERALILEGVGFLLLGVVFYHWMKRRFTRAQPAVDVQAITTMQQSIDAIALEVERISENQRYVTKLLNEGSRPADLVAQQHREPARDR